VSYGDSISINWYTHVMSAIFREIVLGEDLNQNDLEIINTQRKSAFASDNSPIHLRDIQGLHQKFFLLRDRDSTLLSFGRLHSLRVLFRKREYSILGIATIVSIQKGKGYGKALVEEMKKYIQENNKTGIGFCHAGNTGFYQKCNIGFLRNGTERFAFSDKQAQSTLEDAIYYEGQDKLITQMLQYPQEKVVVSRSAW